MKYVILIHSNPQPWGHPTSDYLPEYQQQSADERQAGNDAFDAMLTEMSERGEVLGGEALGDPASARLFRWRDGERVVTDGPYAEAKEVIAGFIIVDVHSEEDAIEWANRFGQCFDEVEVQVRPVTEASDFA